MTLTDLIDQHEKCREQLIVAINNDATPQEIQAIDARLAQLFEAIENLEANDQQDIVKQVRFFLTQHEDFEGFASASVYLKSVDALVTRYANRFATRRESGDKSKNISSKLKISLGGNDYSSKEMIQPSEARVSLFSTQFRYQFTSVGNAKYYNAAPSDFVGKHVLDIIGKQRFAKRAKIRMENCFSGLEQRYFHFLPGEGKGERLIDCHMAPYYDSDNCVRGAYVAVTDITDKFESARQYPHLH